jgi:hypothetical protein
MTIQGGYFTDYFSPPAQQDLPAAQQPLASFGATGPQHALASSQQAAPALQQSCTAAQQAASLAQHFMPLAQQPSFAGAEQHARSLAQQASLALQQSGWADVSSENPGPATRRPRDRTRPERIFVNMEISSGKNLRIHAQETATPGWHDCHIHQ